MQKISHFIGIQAQLKTGIGHCISIKDQVKKMENDGIPSTCASMIKKHL
jgi:hypothetical protein